MPLLMCTEYVLMMLSLRAWVTGEAEPGGLVVIFAPPAPEVVEPDDTPSE